MSQLTPLPIEKIEGLSQPTSSSPFPVLGREAVKGSAGAPVVSAAEITGADVGRMDQLEKMLHAAQGRAEVVEREAYDKAYAAGEKAGLALGQKRAEQIVESMESCLKQAETEVSQMRQHCVDAVVDIAQLVVEQLTGEILAEQKDALYHAAKRAAEKLPEASRLKLAVYPDDLQAFERLLESDNSDWRLVADPSLKPGTCRLVSREQDVSIDPMRALVDSVRRIRVALHSGTVEAEDSAPAEGSDGAPHPDAPDESPETP